MPDNNEFDPQESFATPDIFRNGLCVGQDATLWDGDDEAKTFEALRICADCPVIQSCLAWAIRHEEYGIFGGKTPQARARIRRLERIAIETPERHNRELERLSDIAGPMPTQDLARKWNVTERTVFRWREEHDAVAA
jgi:Transcription factor WhiB